MISKLKHQKFYFAIERQMTTLCTVNTVNLLSISEKNVSAYALKLVDLVPLNGLFGLLNTVLISLSVLYGL